MERLARRLMRDRLRTRIDRLASSNEYVMFHVSPVDRADGWALLKQRIAALRASGALEDCHRQTPLSGTLQVRFILPRTGEENDDGMKAKISGRFGGTLGWTSLGSCAQVAIEQHVLQPGLPEPIQGAASYETFTF